MIGWCGKDCDSCDAIICAKAKPKHNKQKIRVRNYIKAVDMRMAALRRKADDCYVKTD